MNCHKTTWPWDSPRQRTSDGSSLVPCEVCVHVHDSQCVSITGAMLGETKRLVMTQRAGHWWIARLMLPPNRYTARVHVHERSSLMPGPPHESRAWNVTLDVPALQADTNLVSELRFWLRDPTE